MSDKTEKEELKQSQITAVRSELQNLRSDIQDVKGTWENDKPNAKRTTKHVLAKHKTKFAVLLILAIPAYFVLGLEIPEIPEWVFVVMIGIVAGTTIGYMPAKYVVNRFVTDTRKPVAEIDPKNPHDLAVWYVPQERMPDIETYEGEANDINTKRGKGIELRRFEKVTSEGKQHLVGKGTWVGEKSGLELKREITNIAAMEKTLKPYAKKGFAYDVMWPHIMRELQTIVGNQMARSFEDVAVFKGEGLRSEIDDLIEDYNPDNIMGKVEDEDIEEMKNGDSDIDKDALKQFIN